MILSYLDFNVLKLGHSGDGDDVQRNENPVESGNDKPSEVNGREDSVPTQENINELPDKEDAEDQASLSSRESDAKIL